MLRITTLLSILFFCSTLEGQTYLDNGTINDTTVLLYRLDNQIQSKYMYRGNVVKVTLSDSINQSFVSMRQKRSEIQKNPTKMVGKNILKNQSYTPSNKKDDLIRRYKNMGWVEKGYSKYGNYSSVTLERGDVSDGTYCIMILSFDGDQLEGETKNCL